MPVAHKILILGASYGSLLASKLLMAGHTVRLVCLPAEAELMNKEGFRVRMPIKGRDGLVEIDSRKLPGAMSAGGAGDFDPAGFDLVGLAMQEPQYRSPGVRELMERVAQGPRALHVDHEHAAARPTSSAFPASTRDACRGCYTDPTVWDAFDPALMTLCSPDPQAFRPPEEKVNVLQVRLPTNFKAARFPSDAHTAVLRQLEADIEAVRFDSGTEKIELPVKLKVHESVFVPLAKWAMLLAGNYRCVQKDAVRSIKEAVHSDLAATRAVYEWVVRAVRVPRRGPEGPRAVREVRQRGAIAREPVLRGAGARRRRAPTSSAWTAWCRPSRRRRACGPPRSTRSSRWVDGWLERNRRKAA